MVKKTSNGIPEIETFAIGDLVAADYNPRVISDEAMAGLAASIERFGCVEPVVVNTYRGKRTIVGGHQRVTALQQMGAESVACVVVKLAPAEEKLLNVTLNNPRIQGKFIEQIEAFIDNLRDEIADDKAILDLRISEKVNQLSYFNNEQIEFEGDVVDDPEAEWEGMPEFDHIDKTAFRTVAVFIKDDASIKQFMVLMNINITEKTKYIWYPQIEIERLADKRYESVDA